MEEIDEEIRMVQEYWKDVNNKVNDILDLLKGNSFSKINNILINLNKEIKHIKSKQMYQ